MLNKNAAIRLALFIALMGTILVLVSPIWLAVLVVVCILLIRIGYLFTTEKGRRSWQTFLQYRKFVKTYGAMNKDYCDKEGVLGAADIGGYNYNAETNVSDAGILIRVFYLTSRQMTIPWSDISSIILRKSKSNTNLWYAKIYIDENALFSELIIPWVSEFELHIPGSVGFSRE